MLAIYVVSSSMLVIYNF